jgi:1-acyl-sn-glycerol-3-phosphate acyltransferase
VTQTRLHTPTRPNPLSWLQRQRSNLLLAAPFLLSTGVFGTLALLASLWDKSGRLQHRIARIWARACIFFSASRLQVIGLENIPAQSAVFAANHTSYMDTPVVFASLPFQFRILAKKELWSLPFIGWYLDRSGQIPIDTANPRTTLSSFAAGVRTLRNGLSVFVFPEGGRTESGQLQPFLNGAAFLAIRGQVPLVPIALIGVHDLLPPHTAHFYPSRTPLKLIFGPPIPTAHHSIRESEALTLELQNSIAALLDQNSQP